MNSQIPAGMQWVVFVVIIYWGLCWGMVAQKHGKNPLLYGLLSVISPFNLIILGLWAFGRFESSLSADRRKED